MIPARRSPAGVTLEPLATAVSYRLVKENPVPEQTDPTAMVDETWVQQPAADAVRRSIEQMIADGRRVVIPWGFTTPSAVRAYLLNRATSVGDRAWADRIAAVPDDELMASRPETNVPAPALGPRPMQFHDRSGLNLLDPRNQTAAERAEDDELT